MSTERPISITPSRAPRATSVRCARLAAGARKDGTALATASTPVRAEHPAANALSSSSAPTEVALSARTEACPVADTVEAGASRNRPTATTVRIDPTKTAVGRMKAFAESTMPRRLTAVTSTSTPRHSQSRWP